MLQNLDLNKMGLQAMTQEENIKVKGGIIPAIVAIAIFVLGYELGCIIGSLYNRYK